MAKYERTIIGDFDEVLDFCDTKITRGIVPAGKENESYYDNQTTRVAVLVYERYSFLGANRISLCLTIAGEGQHLFISAISSGGGGGIFLKNSTAGEGSFLHKFITAFEERFPLA